MAWVRLNNEDGQFWDRELGFHLRRGEIKELPDPLPPGSATAMRLRMGGFVFCLPPVDVIPSEQSDEEAIPVTEGTVPVRRDDSPYAGPEAPEIEPAMVKPQAPARKKTRAGTPAATRKRKGSASGN